MADTPRDLPGVPSTVPAPIRNPLQRVIEAAQVLLGFRGDPLDMALTWRQLQAQGFASISAIRTGGGGSAPGTITVPGDSVTSTTPDLTPPPTPTGLTVTAGLGHIIVEWDAPTYTQGHGPGQTNVYAAQKLSSDPTLPTFSDAVRVYEAPGALTIAAIPSDLSIRWHVWIKWQSVDGVESTIPEGGTNGVQATTGLIGNADLGPLIVSADKLSQGTYAGVNMVPNPSAEDGTVAWALVESSGTITGDTFTADTSDKVGGTQSFRSTKASAGHNVAYGCQAIPVIPGETYGVKLKVRANAASTAGLYIRVQEKASKPTGGYVTQALRDSYTDLAADVAETATWTSYSYQYTVPAGVFWISLSVYHWGTGTSTSLWWDDVSLGRQITAEYLAAGSIAVGTAAIQNGAIINAMIANLAVDDAKIASVSVAKLVAGSIAVGEYIQSTGFVSGSSGWKIQGNGTAEFGAAAIRGQLVASQIDGRGLTISDTAGNPILSAGSSLSASTLNLPGTVANVPSGWQNANISISAGGVLSGAGGGTVTIGGLGYSGDLNATYGAAWGSNLTGRPTELTDGRITTAINSAGVIVSGVKPGITVTTGGVAGLYLGSDFLGYYNGSAWKTYMDNAGRFYLGGTSGALQWDGSTLNITGGGTFSGALSAATGSFAGSLSAATGTFAGSLSAASGTFAGTLTAAAVNAVDTINLAGNAVTIPVSSYTAGSITVNTLTTGGHTTVQSVTITSTGSPISIVAACQVTHSAQDSGSGGSSTVALDVYRGTTLVATGPSHQLNSATSSVSETLSMAFPPVQDTPGAGTWTYNLRVTQTTSGSLTAASSSAVARGMLLIETKR